jgi:glycerol-3-phosphate dehydrogenase
MWCKEEILNDGSKLTEVINTKHENSKYLPEKKIPDNVIATPDLIKSVQNADILIFVLPHQFVKQTCEELKTHIKSNAFALTLIKVRKKKTKQTRRKIHLFFFRDFILMKKLMNFHLFRKSLKVH